jgi:hypothetical protein
MVLPFSSAFMASMAFWASASWVLRLKRWPVPGILARSEVLGTARPLGSLA